MILYAMYIINKNRNRTLCKVLIDEHCAKCYNNHVRREQHRRTQEKK
jgi:hypothetical protein